MLWRPISFISVVLGGFAYYQCTVVCDHFASKRTQESVESAERGIKRTRKTTHEEQEQVSTTGTCYTGGCITP